MKPLISVLALLLIAALPAWSQTPAEMARVKKLTKRPQTKASSLLVLAGLAESKGDYKKAKEYYGTLLDIYKNDPGVGPDSPRCAYMIAKQGQCEKRVGNKAEAEKKANEALAMVKDYHGTDSKENNYVLMTRQNCSIIMGKALPAPAKAKSIPVPQFKTIPSSDIQDLAQEEKQVKEFMAEHLKKKLDPASPEQMKRILYLANVYTLEKKYSQAEPLFKQVIANIEKKSGKHSPQLLSPLSNYGFLLKQQGKIQESNEVLKRMQLMTGQIKS